MALHLHLQNLPRMAVNLDIRRFFMDFDIPSGGVQIVGGDDGDAFITFVDQRDLLSAMSQNQKSLLGNKVSLRIVDTAEMDLVIDKRCLELKSRRISPSGSQLQHQASLQQPGAHLSQSNISPLLNRKRCGTPPWLREDLDDEFQEVEAKRRRAHDNAYDRSRYLDETVGRRKDTDSSHYLTSIPMTSIAQSFGLNVGPEMQDHRTRDRQHQYSRNINEDRDIPDMPRNWNDLMDRERNPSTVRREPLKIDPDQRASDMPRMRRELPWTEQDRRDTSSHTGDQERSWSYPDQRMGMGPNISQALPYPHEDIREERWMNWGSNMGTWDTGNCMMSDQGMEHNQRQQNYQQGSHTTPGYIRMSNVAKPVTYRNIRQFFKGYMIEKGGIILKADFQNRDSLVAFIQFVHLNDALVFDNGQGMIQGQEVVTKLISQKEYEKSKKKDERPAFAAPGYAMISNLPPMVRYRDIKEYLKEYSLGRINLKYPSEGYDSTTAFFIFKNLDDARSCDGSRGIIHDKEVKIDIISPGVYESNTKDSSQNDAFSKKIDKKTKVDAFSRKIDKKTKVDESQSSDVDQSIKFLAFSKLPSEMTAWNLWQKLGGSEGPCIGVILASLQTPAGGVTEMAFGAYDDVQARTVEKAKHTNVKPLNEKAVFRKLINFRPNFKIFKASPSGKNEIVSEEKIDEMRQSFFPSEEIGILLTDPQVEVRNRAVKKFSKYLFGDRPNPGDRKRITLSPDPAVPSRMYFLGLGGLPEDATACKIWERFGGSNGPCKRVILFSLQENGSSVGNFAYGAYDGFEKRNAEKKNHNNVVLANEKAVYFKVMYYVDNFDVTIFRSSPSGIDEVLSNEEVRQRIFQKPEKGVALTKVQLEERQLAVIEVNKYLFESQASEDPKKSKGPLEDSKKSPRKKASAVKETTSVSPGKAQMEYLLRLTELPWNVTACEIWNWFDGPQGPSTGVTLVCKSSKGADSAVLANVAFKDSVSRKQAKEEHPEARSYSVQATYRNLALFGPQFDIFTSTCEGKDRLMTKEERVALRQKYFPSKAVDGETVDQDKIQV